MVIIEKDSLINKSILNILKSTGASMAAKTPPTAGLEIGDKVQVDLYCICIATRFGKGCVYLETIKPKDVVNKYPDLLSFGLIEKL